MTDIKAFYHASPVLHAPGTRLVPGQALAPEVGTFPWRTDRVWLAIERGEAEEWAAIVAMSRHLPAVYLYRVRPLTRVYLSLDSSTDLMQASTSAAEVLELVTTVALRPQS